MSGWEKRKKRWVGGKMNGMVGPGLWFRPEMPRRGWSRPVVQARDVKAWAVKELKSWAGVLNIHLEKDSAGRGKGWGWVAGEGGVRDDSWLLSFRGLAIQCS